MAKHYYYNFRRLTWPSQICLAIFLFVTSKLALADSTSDLVNKYRNTVVQVRILENSSQTKASIGSGFFVSKDGHIITNYHVISQLIQFPNSYTAEFIPASGQPQRLSLIDVDVVHDLALVKAESQSEVFLDPTDSSPLDGEKLFSMGNPHDLGFTIVEGTYNGLIEESLYEKIHYSGSINPGMSGGPSILANGRLVGVNVSTAGNQISFLVPAKYVQNLAQRNIASSNAETNMDITDKISQQLLANQQNYLQELSSKPLNLVKLAEFEVPGQISPALKCWSKSHEDQERPFKVLSYSCSSQDEIFLSDDHETGSISYYHNFISSDSLNAFQFYALYQAYFESNGTGLSGEEKELTNFRCHSGYVNNGGISFKTGICYRAYRQFEGLFDVVLKAASLSANNYGLQTTLVLSGVNFTNGQAFAKKYLEGFKWNAQQ